MEQKIVDIIEDKAKAQLARMSETKAKSYKAMLYAGVRVTLDEVTLKQVAKEIGYSSISAISKLVHRWNEKVTEGDVAIHRIVSAYNKLQKRKLRTPKKITLQTEDVSKEDDVFAEIELAEAKRILSTPKDKPKGRWCLGFWITPEDEMRERAAKRASMLFFQKYGQGRQPRTHGEFYTPGSNPEDRQADKSKWMPLETAAMYCGCNASVIEKAGQNEEISRRVYKRNKSRNYYEYLVSDLDVFIKKNGLL